MVGRGEVEKEDDNAHRSGPEIVTLAMWSRS